MEYIIAITIISLLIFVLMNDRKHAKELDQITKEYKDNIEKRLAKEKDLTKQESIAILKKLTKNLDVTEKY
jgi:uncharacterized protein YoxC